MIFTARENFKAEFIKNARLCKSCMKYLHECTALVVRWSNKKGRRASLAVCDEECWSNFDHNYWLERRAKKEIERGNNAEAMQCFDARVPKYQPTVLG
jgi:hypothetical protein